MSEACSARKKEQSFASRFALHMKGKKNAGVPHSHADKRGFFPRQCRRRPLKLLWITEVCFALITSKRLWRIERMVRLFTSHQSACSSLKTWLNSGLATVQPGSFWWHTYSSWPLMFVIEFPFCFTFLKTLQKICWLHVYTGIQYNRNMYIQV